MQYMSLFISGFSFCRGRKGTKAELRAHLNGVLTSLKDVASQRSIPCLSSCLQLCPSPVFVKIFDALYVAADASAG